MDVHFLAKFLKAVKNRTWTLNYYKHLEHKTLRQKLSEKDQPFSVASNGNLSEVPYLIKLLRKF